MCEKLSIRGDPRALHLLLQCGNYQKASFPEVQQCGN